jgi:hypothetical protein
MHASNDYEDTDWYQVLEERLSTEEKFKDLDRNQLEHIPEIAQRLLDNPINRELLGIKSAFESPGQEE